MRLADAYRTELDDAAAAVEWYGRALDVDPAHEGARAGLQALLGDVSIAPAAARRLAVAAEKTDSWQLLLDLVPMRLAGVSDPKARARILEDAAVCAETRAGDHKRALAWLCEALPLAGTSARLEQEVLRLAEVTGEFAGPARAIGESIAAGGAPPLTLAHLHERRGSLLEERVADLAAAAESYAAALALTPERLEPRRSLVRTLVRLGRFAEAARLLVDAKTTPDARDAVLMPLYESLALERGEIRGAVTALANAVAAAPGLDPSSRRDLHARIATALVDHCQDMDAADAAFDQALAADPRHVATLLRLAESQRRRPDRRLVDTLTRLAVEQPDNLDFLREAAESRRPRSPTRRLPSSCSGGCAIAPESARAGGPRGRPDGRRGRGRLRHRRDRAAARRVGNAGAVATGRPRCCSTGRGCGSPTSGAGVGCGGPPS